MKRRNGPPPIVYILAFLGLVWVGYQYFSRSQENIDNLLPIDTDSSVTSNTSDSTAPCSAASTPNTASTSSVSSVFPVPTSVPSDTTVKIDGATSMVTINEILKKDFQAKFPGTSVTTNGRGTEIGIQALQKGQIDIAAVSRPLKSEEINQGLVSVPITTDEIAIVVWKDNPFSQGLTSNQVCNIFRGKINKWSQIGGFDTFIQVYNRNQDSGTRTVFQELVLKGASFGAEPNFSQLPKDGTTNIFRQLGIYGISYATFLQADLHKQTLRVVPVDGLTPKDTGYPYKRQLFYVYKNPASPAVQAFLGYATSPDGQKTLSSNN